MIRLHQEGPIAIITLARPERRNALTVEMLERLGAAVSALPPGSRAVVLAGEGKVFCSGFDLDLCRDNPGGTVMRSLLTGLSAAIRAFRESPLPVVCAAQGAAIAGGCALLGGADVVISHAAAKFGYPVTRIGVSPAVSAPFLAGSIGLGATRERQLDASLIEGLAAHTLGLVQHLADGPEQVLPFAMKVATALAAKPTGAMAATKQWLNELDAMASPQNADRGLAASAGLTGGDEERRLLTEFWKS